MSSELSAPVPVHNIPAIRNQEQSLGEQVLGFFTVKGLSKALIASSWSVERELQLLVEIAQDTSVDPEVRMAAADKIREHLKSSLMLEGHLNETHAVSQMEQGGRVVTAHITGTRFSATRETQRMLEAALGTDQIIDVESEETGDVQAKRYGGRPERDIGGGGLCKSAQLAARAARQAASEKARSEGIDVFGIRVSRPGEVPEGGEGRGEGGEVLEGGTGGGPGDSGEGPGGPEPGGPGVPGGDG